MATFCSIDYLFSFQILKTEYILYYLSLSLYICISFSSLSPLYIKIAQGWLIIKIKKIDAIPRTSRIIW